MIVEFVNNINVVEVLKTGTTGFIFLLTLLSFLLLAREQKFHPERIQLLKCIKFFVITNVFISAFTLTTVLISPTTTTTTNEQLYSSVEGVEVVTASSITNQGVAAVCMDAKYFNQYLLLRNISNNGIIQVLVKNPLPCASGQEQIVIGNIDAEKLGLEAINNKDNVAISSVSSGFKFVLSQEQTTL